MSCVGPRKGPGSRMLWGTREMLLRGLVVVRGPPVRVPFLGAHRLCTPVLRIPGIWQNGSLIDEGRCPGQRDPDPGRVDAGVC